MKLLIDMNLSPAWVKVLSTDFETLHWSDQGRHDAPDSEIFAWARERGYVVFTNDLDFGTLLAYSKSASPSVFQIRSLELDPNNVGEQVLRCFRHFQRDLETGALITYDGKKERVRKLPLT